MILKLIHLKVKVILRLRGIQVYFNKLFLKGIQIKLVKKVNKFKEYLKEFNKNKNKYNKII
jgi:hypothetical protein